MADTEAIEAPPLTQVDLTDYTSLRRELEANALYALTVKGYSASYLADNIRIALGLAIVAIVAAAHLPLGEKFPENYQKTVICVVLYYLVAGLHFLFSAFILKDSFMIARKPQSEAALRLRLHFARCRYDVSMIVECAGRTEKGQSCSVQTFFHSDGYIAQDAFRSWVQTEVEQLVGRLSAKPKSN